MRYRTLDLLLWVATLLVIVGPLMASIWVVPRLPSEYWGGFTAVLLGWVFGGAYFSRNWLQTIIDAKLVGVCGLRLNTDSSALIRFRDDEFAEETKKLIDGRANRS